MLLFTIHVVRKQMLKSLGQKWLPFSPTLLLARLIHSYAWKKSLFFNCAHSSIVSVWTSPQRFNSTLVVFFFFLHRYAVVLFTLGDGWILINFPTSAPLKRILMEKGNSVIWTLQLSAKKGCKCCTNESVGNLPLWLLWRFSHFSNLSLEYLKRRGGEKQLNKRDQGQGLHTSRKELVCIMRLYLNLVSVMIKADPCDNGTGVQESASWVLKSYVSRPASQLLGNLTHKMGYSVAYKTEQSISMVPPILVVIEGVM